MTAPAVPAELAGEYKRLHDYGLPVDVVRHRFVVSIGGDLQAVIMPEHWGFRVQMCLAEWGIGGPMFSQPGRRIVFLAGRYRQDDQNFAVNGVMRLTDSFVMESRKTLTLPTPGNNDTPWIAPVVDQYRPAVWCLTTALTTCWKRETE